MKIIKLDVKNIDTEHICCGFSDKKCAKGYNLKKELIKERLPEGFIFKKFDVQHKVFIEYVPAENAWSPIEAPGYMFIHCFWVAGRYKGLGLGTKLLNECIKDSKGKNGIVVVTSKKTMSFLTDKTFFIKRGFEVCDSAPPYFELLVNKLKKAPLPKFRDNVKEGLCKDKEGLTFYYSHQCPFTDYYIGEMVKIGKKYGIPSKIILMNTKKDAQSSPSPSGIFGVFYNGNFLTHEIMSQNKFEKLLHKTIKA